ncbi:MAG TPA: hypothetical protein VMR21_11820, partial [Vicinamibacteria bacterium]|nr:hypothetical protein [Vicinamibacteria bacterium]
MASSTFAAVWVAAAALAVTAPAHVFAQPALRPAPDLTAGAAEVRAFLDGNGSPHPLCATADGRVVWAAVQDFYAGRGHRPVWLEGERLSPAGERLAALLRATAEEGLDPRHYDPAALAASSSEVLRASMAAEPVIRQAARWEVGMTAAFARLAADVGRGRVEP